MSRLLQSRPWTKVKIELLSNNLAASSSAIVEPLAAAEVQWDKAKSYYAIPGPSALSLVRGFAPGGKYFGLKLLDVHRMMRQDYGKLIKFKGTFGKRDILMITSPEDYETLFRREPAWPQRRGMDVFVHYRKHLRKDVFKGVGGLLTEQGEAWHKFRSTVNPILMHPKATRAYIPLADRISQEFIGRLRSIRDAANETPPNFSEEVNRWTMESVSCIALDTRLGVLSDYTIDEKSKQFIKSVRAFFDLTFQVDVNPPFWRWFQTPTFKKFLATSDELTEIVGSYVDEAIARLERKPTPAGQEPGVLEKLMKINKHTAKVMAFDMLLAGADTTASGFIGVLYALARHPEKQEKLRKELQQFLPDEDAELSAEQMKNLPYLRAVIKEGLRIYPPTVNIVRSAAQDMVMQGYQIPKDTDIAISNLIVSNDDGYFPSSHEFIPERWLKAGPSASTCPHLNTKSNNTPFIYLPFGYGPRSCVGRRFAEMLIEVLVTRLIQTCVVEWHHGEMAFQSGLANVPVGDIKFRLIDVKR